jgi:hypothetical protein
MEDKVGTNTRLADTVPDSECFVELRKRAASGDDSLRFVSKAVNRI